MVGNQWSVGKKQLAVGEPTFLANVAMFFTSSTGNTGNLAFFNGSNHNYGMMGVVSGNGTPTGDVYGLGYTAAANSSFTNVLNWTSTSHVGIGTTTPARSLHIVSPSTEPVALRLERYDAGPFNSGEIAFANLNGEQVYMGLKDNSQLAIKGNGDFTVGEPTLLVNVQTGNVGVGTGNPTCNFHVKANDGNADMCLESTNGHAWDLAADQAGNFGVYQPSSGQTRFQINSDGNVGIGTNSPIVSKFEIKSNGTTNASSALHIKDNNNTSLLYVRDDGSVGIGTSFPDNPNNYKLAVNGTIGAKHVKVETVSTTWPDYVFKDNYEMMSLNELEKFTKTKKHLPGIDSAEEIKENGIDVSDMFAKLLKKNEEAILYILQLKKENEELAKQIAEINKKIK